MKRLTPSSTWWHTLPHRENALMGATRRGSAIDYVGIDLHKKESEICSMVADPNFAPMFATRSRKVKTDRRDARALAEPACWGVPPGASPLGRTAASAGAPDGARCLGPDAHRLHRPDPSVAALVRLARADGEC